MIIHPSKRTMCVLIAAATISVAGGCGTGVLELMAPAGVRAASSVGSTTAQGERPNGVLVPADGRDSLAEVHASPRPVRVYRVGPAAYLATNLPEPPRGNDTARQLGNEATRQQGNEATMRRGNKAMRQQGTGRE